jgi:hypothetical protein
VLSGEAPQPTNGALQPCAIAWCLGTQPFLPIGIVTNHQLGLCLQTLGLWRNEDTCGAFFAQQPHPEIPRPRVLILGNPDMIIGSAPADDLFVGGAPPTAHVGFPLPKYRDMLNLVDRVL